MERNSLIINMTDYGYQIVRASSQPTASYVAGTVIEHVHLRNQLMLYVDVTIGTATSVSVKIEFSDDNTNWYQETAEVIDATTGIITHTAVERRWTANAAQRVAIPTLDKYIKISTKGTGTLTTTTVGIKAITGRA